MTTALIMAGGLGLRLRPITNDMPKPMVEIGGKPILEHTVERLVRQGIRQIWIIVGYRAQDIIDHFNDGSQFGAEINYVREEVAMGTAGAISLLPPIFWPLLVLNGDLMVDMDFQAMVKFHQAKRSIATMGVRDYTVAIPYGVVEQVGGVMVKLAEKPLKHYLISAGVYVLSPESLPHVKRDMPDIFHSIMADHTNAWPAVYKIPGSWMDIGTPEDLAHAQRMVTV